MEMTNSNIFTESLQPLFLMQSLLKTWEWLYCGKNLEYLEQILGLILGILGDF